MPPRSFVSSVYCAAPSSTRSRSFERTPCRKSGVTRALDVQLPHVRDVEDAPVGRTARCSGMTPGVLNGHLPSRERHQARPEGDVPLEQRRPPERLDDVHGRRLYPSQGLPSPEPRPRSGVRTTEPRGLRLLVLFEEARDVDLVRRAGGAPPAAPEPAGPEPPAVDGADGSRSRSRSPSTWTSSFMSRRSLLRRSRSHSGRRGSSRPPQPR